MRAITPRHLRLRHVVRARGAPLFLLVTPIGSAQTQAQLWGEVRLDWIKSHDFTYSLDVEPKVLGSKPADDPGWATLDITPSVE